MTVHKSDRSSKQRPLRLWPGVVAVALQWFAWLVIPLLVPSTTAGYVSALGALACGLAVFVWWAFFSRAPRLDRFGAIVLMVLTLAATPYLLDESLATAGQGMMFVFYAIPLLCLAFVAWAVISRRLPERARRPTMVATILLACGAWALVRTGGVHATGTHFAWRWSATPEQRLLAQPDNELKARASLPLALDAEADWPGFRGAGRDGVVRDTRIETDWAASPPAEVWRRPIGPGWSSFAVQGDLLYTQEQRGEEEVVACYDATTGEPVWRHSDSSRFWEANAGAGPRATPTLSNGRVYTLGATGIVNALEAGDGRLVWSSNLVADTGAEIPYWGFSSSPVVVEDVVVVAAAGQLAGYELASGQLRWVGPARGGGYSSPHLMKIDEVSQIVLLSGEGAVSVAPGSGSILWEHAWPGSRIVQPARTSNGDLLIGSDPVGTRRIAVARGPAGWNLEERWTSTGLKPYFSDFVVHEGHAFGFDGPILAAIDLEDGGRKWKGGRYGNGQLVLLPDQDLLLVITERGELALVSATTDRFTELARVPAIEGKTWNHPVLVGDLLLLRNAQEMVAFRLALAG